MPKPIRKPNWKSQYEDPDVRGQENNRRVTFKTSRLVHGRADRAKEWAKDWGATIRAHLEDEDVDMGAMGATSSGRGMQKKWQRRGGSRGSPAPPGHDGKRKFLQSPTHWYRIFMPYGNKYAKDHLLEVLLSKINPLPLIPIMWQANGNMITFFIDDFKTAEKLSTLNRQIPMADGFNLVIRVTCGTPNVEITPELKERMKAAMATRYNAHTKAMDLTRFHVDDHLRGDFCALSKNNVCVAVVGIIAENIPYLEALKLDHNNIQMLAHLKNIQKKLPNLKILHLGHNKLRDVHQLEALQQLDLVELMLDGNPLCDKFKDQATYVSVLRKRFPKLMRLDGVDLPAPIGFDIAKSTDLPESRRTFLCNAEGQPLMRRFLEEYFLVLDNDNRQPLLQAYHEQAQFSMTMSLPYGQPQKTASWLNWYNTDNRNLKRVVDLERRCKLLKQGHLQVVAFLSEMPATKHDVHSFTVDLMLYLPTMYLVTVTGLFKELKTAHKTPPIRHFLRTFVIVPAGSGLCIANEQLHVTNATDEQIRIAFKTPVPAPVPVTIEPPLNELAGISLSQSEPDDVTKQQMIQTLCQESGMKPEWSQQCLQDTNWVFETAVFAYKEAKLKGLLPPDAFVQ